MAILSNMSIEFVSGKGHYDKAIERVASVKKSLWIGTQPTSKTLKSKLPPTQNRLLAFLPTCWNAA